MGYYYMNPEPRGSGRMWLPFVIALVCLIFLVVGIQIVRPHWQQCVNVAGNYSVTFPNTPKDKTREIQTAFGPSTLHTKYAETHLQRCYYSVSYLEMTIEPPKTGLDAFLNDAAMRSVTGTGGTLVSTSTVRSGNLVGREVIANKLQKGRPLCLRTRVFVVGRRIYTVVVCTTGYDSAKSKEANRFVDSFSLM